ncbi:MAG: glycosyltransferase, partial [Candidatus Omnitrophota bacterium]|nr:glycosyltransferase [Candidatus Omnitrophota bacterium]
RPTGQPVRVMYVIWSLGLGGAEQVVIRLASGLDRGRFEPVICCLSDEGPFAEQARAAGITVVALGKRGRYDVTVLWKLIRLMRVRRVDVVHTHLWGANLWGRLAARLASVRTLVATEHNVDTWKPWYYFWLDRWLAGRTSALVAVSRQVREFYEAHGVVGRGGWQVIYNGVDADSACPRQRDGLYKALGIGRYEPVVGWVGRFVPAKAPTVFLEAIARASREIPSIKAVVVGDGPLRRDVEAQVRRLGLQRRVILTGVRQDMPELFAGMDALAVSSEREGCSMAMLEAMAHSVPVVATRVGGTPELIESGVTGILVPPGQPDALAEPLVELLNNPTKANAIRRAARERVEQHFSLRRMIADHEALYQNQFAEPANRPTRICYIIDNLGRGGAQRQLVELVQALPKETYQVHVVSLSARKLAYAPTLRDAGIRLIEIPQSGAWSWGTFFRLVATLRRLRPDVVHTWLFTADLYGRVCAWLAGVPVIISAIRNTDPDKPRHYVAVDRLLRRVTDAFTVNAEAVKAVAVARERIEPGKLHTIYNGVDVERFKPNGKAEGGAPLIGIIGRLAPQKDHETFLRAAALVARQAPGAQFLIVGDGPSWHALQELVRALGLEPNVHFLPSRTQITEVLAALDVIVVSSRYEGCCNVILEAMAMAKPIIATAVGGNPELIVPGATGWLVPPGDPPSLARAVGEALRQPQRAKLMGYWARKRAETHFSLPRMVEQTTALYRSLLKSHP